MSRLIKLCLVILLILSQRLNAVAQHATLFTKQLFITGTDTLPYRLIYPAGYNPHKKYPLVVFLHGDGARGTDNEKQLTSMPRALTDSAARLKYQCFILAPQCPAKQVWAKFPHFPQSLQSSDKPTLPARQALDLINQMLKSIPLDKRRIYLTGYSGGGEGTFDMLTRNPKLFAAAVPVCSVSDTSKAFLISKIPVWLFHGENDQVNNVKYSRLMIDALKTRGGNPKYTEYPGMGHNVWVKAFEEPGLFDWMFAQKK